MFVAVPPRLAGEDDLVDAELLVAPQVVPYLRGGADGTAQTFAAPVRPFGAQRVRRRAQGRGVIARLGAPLLVLGPDVGHSRPVAPEHVVVRQRVAEEVGAFRASSDGLG